MTDWIKCSDRMPPKDTKVLCYYYGYIDVMEYWGEDREGKPEFYNPPSPPVNKVSHWMPLPNPPNDVTFEEAKNYILKEHSELFKKLAET